jgi:exonuclease SbcC
MRPHRLVLAGFGAFANRAEVDFDKLNTHGLYLIIGETGSGKTTIFDAMTYALYGDVAGNRDSGSVASDYDNCDSPYVEFEFTHKQKRFLIKRKIKSSDVSEHSISEISPDGKTLNAVTGKTAVKNFVQELIGLDADQFMKVVLLPQGKFEQFLVATSKDREEMLQALFGTEVYEKVSESMIVRSDQQVREASAVLQDLSSKEDSAQKFLDTLKSLGYEGEIPDLQNGCEEPLRILREQRGNADKAADSGQKLLTDAAKKLQAVTDEVDLYTAGQKLAELVALTNKLEKQVSAAGVAISDHGKAKPVSQANESAKEANLKKDTAEQNLQTIDSSISEIIRSHKSNSIISAISKMRLGGVASVNAYIAKSKGHIEKAVLKNDQAEELEDDASNANDEIAQDKKRSEEIKKLLKGLSEKLNKASAEQKIQQSAIAKLSNLKTQVAELDNLLEISNVAEAKSELKFAAAEFERSSGIYDKAREALKSAHELRIRHLAGELGASLKSG